MTSDKEVIPKKLPLSYLSHKQLMTKNISNKISPKIIKFASLDPEKYFIFLPTETFNIPIIVDRENEFCVGPVVNAKNNTKLNLCGVLRSVVDPLDKKEKGKSFLYIYLYGINEILD